MHYFYFTPYSTYSSYLPRELITQDNSKSLSVNMLIFIVIGYINFLYKLKLYKYGEMEYFCNYYLIDM